MDFKFFEKFNLNDIKSETRNYKIVAMPIVISYNVDGGEYYFQQPESMITMPTDSYEDGMKEIAEFMFESFFYLNDNSDCLGPIPIEQLIALKKYIHKVN